LKLIYRQHAVRRMFELGISTADVSSAQVSGRVIEDYPTDTPYLSCLWLGFAGNCPLHLVYADNPAPMVNASSLPSMNPIPPCGWRTATRKNP